MASFISTGFLMIGLGLALSVCLAVANKRFHVFEDPRIDEVEELLPNSNCGACGHPGCRAFAEAAVSGVAAPGLCTVSSPEAVDAIATYLGVDAGGVEKRVARLACAGGSNVARTRLRYSGHQTCRSAAMVSGGGKGCAWGCLGYGDCRDVCDFDAITMGHDGLPRVDDARCTACNDCVEICPLGLFSIEPISHRLWIACKNLLHGEQAEADCQVACTACGKCAADAPPGLITMEDNLAVLHYENNALASKIPIERCPTGAIVWFDDSGAPVKGCEAMQFVRKESLPLSKVSINA